MTVDEFLAWAEGQQGRWELLDGVPMAMSPERAGHDRSIDAANKTIQAALRRAKLCFSMFLFDCVPVRLDTRTVFQPDLVVCGGDTTTGDGFDITNPVVVVEFLSPSTLVVDMRLKVLRYFELPSVQHYLILDPDDRSVIHYERGEGDVLLTRIVSNGELRLEPPPRLIVEAASLFPEPHAS